MPRCSIWYRSAFEEVSGLPLKHTAGAMFHINTLILFASIFLLVNSKAYRKDEYRKKNRYNLRGCYKKSALLTEHKFAFIPFSKQFSHHSFILFYFILFYFLNTNQIISNVLRCRLRFQSCLRPFRKWFPQKFTVEKKKHCCL